ncbi:hypothetical protein KIW84_010332 [Lathyrus oleraceus]|uniref:Uncharacterized protein n=1 Tax=Pisum sativum TaxID=3888 RepID=A0A9D5BDL8_PEA|nr:hypothetical protein KIW84_010332 [Pisum sativum]
MGNLSSSSNQKKSLPIDTTFKLPSNIPTWPQGGGFGSGIIDLGGLKVSQISTFNKIWTTLEGGQEDLGATFFEPTQIPQGFFSLGHYSQPNNKPLFGWVLVAKDESNGALKSPIDYTLVWSSKSQKIKQDKDGYIWLPIAPNGYSPLGHIVTTTPEKPSLDRIQCVRSDLTDQCEINSWIWGKDKKIDEKGFNVHCVRPSNRGTQAPSVLVGTFLAHVGEVTNSPLPISCLKNSNFMSFSSMPNLPQVKALAQGYSPIMYLHPNEKFQPCSIKWYFTNGALLYKKEEEANPIEIDPLGSNLPQGGSNDGSYWIDLPKDKANRERVKKGTLKVGLIDNISLGKIGEHIGDWEHVTLRISNFNGELRSVYFSQHSNGQWVDASEVEFQSGNKSVAYSSLNGHAIYSKAGLVLQGVSEIGIKNETKKSEMVVDFGDGFEIVSGDYLGDEVVEPSWLNFFRQWGPKITYDLGEELKKLDKIVPGLKLPNELLGEEGPTGPKLKRNWIGDEV